MKKNIILLLLINSILFSNGQTIELIGYYNINGTIAIASLPGYMIISSGDIIDISDPTSPELISTYSFDYAASIITEEDFAYFGTEMTCNLYIADISNINFPLHQGFLDFGSDIGHGVFGMAKNDSVLFVTIGASFCSIDITDKTNPAILDTLFITGGQSRDVCLNGPYAFVAHEMGLKVIDVSVPENMQIISSIGSGYISIDLDQTRAYLGKGFTAGGIDVIDITDPAHPSAVFSVPNSGGTSWDIKKEDNLIYLAANAGLYIYKIENNDAQEMANYLETGGQTFAVCLQDSLILLSELVTGVAILQYDSTGTVGIKSNMDIDKDFLAFPNPAKDVIYIQNRYFIENVHVCIYNSQGKIMDVFGLSEDVYRHNISNYPPGIYFCKFKRGGKSLGQTKFSVL